MQGVGGIGQDHVPPIDLARDAILLDIDGTLLDIVLDPDDARVPDALRQALERLAGATAGALALVSGRTLESIDALFAPLKTAAIGCHGVQMRVAPDAEEELRARPLPKALRQTFADIATLEPDIRIEDKVFSLAFHYRKAPDRRDRLHALLCERIAPFDREFTLMAGKSIFEIKPRCCTKGEALRELMRRRPFFARRPVFLGDDTTDEYAFAVLPDFSGVGISVGRRSPNAEFMLSAPHDVRRWLISLSNGDKGQSNE